MYPIMLIFAGGIAIAIERFLFLRKEKRVNAQAWEKLKPLLDAGSLAEANALVLRSNSSISHILKGGLVRARHSRDISGLESALEEGLMDVVPRFEKRTHYLATFANVATLMGLLGTIIGLIQAFTAVSNANPSEKADLLSSSISVAMNTTAFGLIVAIPLLLLYSVLQTKTNEIVDGLEAFAVKIINTISIKQ